MPRLVCFIPPTAYNEHMKGWRVAFCKEGEAGYYPTGGKEENGELGWYWGPTLGDAERLADERNQRAGISKEEAQNIIMESMVLSKKQGLPSANRERRNS